MNFPSLAPHVFTFQQHRHITSLGMFVDLVRLTYLIRIHTNISTMVGDHSNEDYRGLSLSIWCGKKHRLLAPVNTTYWILCKHVSGFGIFMSLTVMQLYIDG